MLRIPSMELMSNDIILEKMEIRRTLICSIRRRQLKFLGYIMKKEGLKNLTVTGHIEGKRDKGKQHITYLQACVNGLHNSD